MPRGIFVSFEGCGKSTLAQDHPARVRLLDAAGSIEHLAERIWQEISPRLA